MMMRHVAALFVVLAVCSVGAWPNTYTVSNTNNDGFGSLRSAIQQANMHLGPDTVTLAPALAGATISLSTTMTYLNDAGTTLDGDLNDDSLPDIVLDGSALATGNGLVVTGDGCTIEGLAISWFPGAGIVLLEVEQCGVYACHLGVDLAGTQRVGVQFAGVEVRKGSLNAVGASGRTNVFAAGELVSSQDAPRDAEGYGVWLRGAANTTVAYNHFGLNRAGDALLGSGAVGVGALDFQGARPGGNRIHHNLFGGLQTGIEFLAANANTVYANTFGLGADGDTVFRIGGACVSLAGASEGSLIGGAGSSAHNVFAGNAQVGVLISGTGTKANRIAGNWFGTNAAGIGRRALGTGVYITNGAGAQTIGGTQPTATNYFAPNSNTAVPRSIVLIAGDGTTIRNNVFGMLPNGRNSLGANTHIRVVRAGAGVLDNTIANAAVGVSVEGLGPVSLRTGDAWGSASDKIEVFGNTLRSCSTAIQILTEADLRLGNLSNASTDDDGGNVFRASNTWFIRSDVSKSFRAEGNDFGTTVKAEIDAKIYDRLDQASLGRIDFDPLIGGVHPTSGGTGGGLRITGTTAVPAAGGAEIAYTLSAPASVTITVRNLAGRPIATVIRDRDPAVGLQRTLWNACADNGLRAPSGTYMVEIAARSADGGQARSLATVRLQGR